MIRHLIVADNTGWDRYIQPLDKGSFDVAAFLKTLKELGYTDLSSVMARFARCRYAQLPVVDSAGAKITGLVSRHEVIAAYDARLAAVRSRVPRLCPSASRSRLPRRLFPRGRRLQ
jgi:hypothetical protein